MNLPIGLCIKCQKDFLHCECEQFHPSSPMIQDGDDYIFMDEFGTAWRLKRWRKPEMPFVITPIKKE